MPIQHVTSDRIKETTTTTGTGTLTLAGAVTGFKTFGSVMNDGDTCHYVIENATGSEWETGLGRWNTGGTLARVEVDRSTNADGKVNFSAGTKNVYISLLATRNQQQVKIALLGDSAAAQDMLDVRAWPDLLEQHLNESGGYVSVRNLSTNGHTLFRHNTFLNWSNNTMSSVQSAIAWKADIVIVSSGQNDVVNKDDGRTLAQCKTDANTTFDTLRAGLPNALLIYAGEQGFDANNFATPGTSLKNKGTFPKMMQLKTSGILANTWCYEMMDDQANATFKANYAEWQSFDTYVKTIANVDYGFTVNYWKMARLGLLGFRPDPPRFNGTVIPCSCSY
jgi:hypothetical protein